MPPTGSTAPSPSHDQTSAAVLGRIRRDVESGLASGEVRGTTTAWCTWAATTRPPCWRHWQDERDLLAHRQHRADRAAGSNRRVRRLPRDRAPGCACRSEEHTSELQSRVDLVCRLLLEKKKKNHKTKICLKKKKKKKNTIY